MDHPLHPVVGPYGFSVDLTVQSFAPEMESALAAFDRYVVALDKVPEDAGTSLASLVGKAITAYISRQPGMRHGIALDRHLTVILSQNDTGPRPLCGIYFNLHSPYTRKTPARRNTGEAANA